VTKLEYSTADADAFNMAPTERPVAMPLGGVRHPLALPGPRLRKALVASNYALGSGELEFPAPIVDGAETRADATALKVLRQVARDHATLPPVASRDKEVLRLFTSISFAGWSAANTLLGTPDTYSGRDEGSIDECSQAVIARSECYAMFDLMARTGDAATHLDYVISKTVLSICYAPHGTDGANNAFTGSPQRAEQYVKHVLDRIVFPAALGHLPAMEIWGLLRGAAITGFSIAAAELDVFSGPPKDGFGVLVPHHHRFDWRCVGTPLRIKEEYVLMVPCSHARCDHLQTRPSPPPHPHRFNLDQRIVVVLQGRPLYRCGERGCDVYRLYDGPEEQYR
jgi:hypothetical protein